MGSTAVEARAEAIDLIGAAVDKAAANSNVRAITPENAKAITVALASSLAPVIVNAASKEPWYQSRVYWGLILTALFTLLKPFLGEVAIDDATTKDIAAALATFGQMAGLALSWYGRYRAAKLKPLGS